MRSKAYLFAAGLLIWSGGAALAETPPPEKKEKRICREMNRIGSRLATRRICLTRDEWDKVATASKRALDDVVQARSNSSIPPPPPR